MQPMSIVPQSNTALVNPADMYLATLGTAMSSTSMRGALNGVVATLGFGRVEEATPRGPHRNVSYRYFPWSELRVEHVVAIRARLMEAEYAPDSINKMLMAVKGVMRQCKALRLIDRDTLLDILDVRGVPGGGLPGGSKRVLSQVEFLRIIDAGRAEDDARRARNDSLLWLLYLTGMRRGEAVAHKTARGWRGLTLDRWDVAAQTLLIVGKGRRARRVPVEGSALDALRVWLAHRRNWPGPLYTRIRQDDSITREPLTESGVYQALKSRADNATPPVRDVSPHTLRRTAVTEMELRGVPEAVIQRLMGHVRADTTRKYFYPPDSVFVDAVRRRDVQR